jgi:hypothetical protein
MMISAPSMRVLITVITATAMTVGSTAQAATVPRTTGPSNRPPAGVNTVDVDGPLPGRRIDHRRETGRTSTPHPWSTSAQPRSYTSRPTRRRSSTTMPAPSCAPMRNTRWVAAGPAVPQQIQVNGVELPTCEFSLEGARTPNSLSVHRLAGRRNRLPAVSQMRAESASHSKLHDLP